MSAVINEGVNMNKVSGVRGEVFVNMVSFRSTSVPQYDSYKNIIFMTIY